MSSEVISVLIPTRGRPDSFARSVDSLIYRASEPDRLEVLAATDQDDPTRVQVAGYLDTAPCTTCHITSGERYGYRRLNEYFNLLAKAATGGWLVLWNDDALMQTQGWDQVLREVHWSFLVAELQDQHWTPRGLSTFPAVRRAAYEAVGSFSAHTCHCDTYWSQLSRDTGTATPVPIQIRHLRYDISGEHNDETWRQGQAEYDTHRYYTPEIQGLIAMDTAKIRQVAEFRRLHIKE